MSPPEQPSTSAGRLHKLLQCRWLISAALFLATLAVFWPVILCQFITYDDPYYVTENWTVLKGMTPEGVAWAFKTPYAGNWHPLTTLSHMLDVEMFGTNPAGHHLTSLLFHGLNAAILFLLLRRLTGAHWRSAFVAALFALHPLRVESVAWVAERKDVLCACFGFLTIWLYALYVAETKANGRKRWWYYGAALFLFALGLLCKPMLVTWPFLLLLLDCWPLNRVSFFLGRIQWKKDFWLVVEKAPFLVLTVASSIVTMLMQKAGGAMSNVSAHPIPLRVTNAAVACWLYIQKTFWPEDMAVFYPYNGHPGGLIIFAGGFLILITACVLFFWRKKPFLATGWFWFLGTLVPVIGLVQVGVQSMADRYTYIPLIGLYVMLTWGIWEVVKRFKAAAVILTIGGCVVLGASSIATSRQLLYWTDDFALYQHAVKVTKGNYIMHINLGVINANMGRLERAMQHYQAAYEINPEEHYLQLNLGSLYLRKKEFEKGVQWMQSAVRTYPNFAYAYDGWGYGLHLQGKYAEAEPKFREAIKRKPDMLMAHLHLALTLTELGRYDEASVSFGEAMRLNPKFAGGLYQWGLSLLEAGKKEEAIRKFDACLKLAPNSIEVFNLLVRTLTELGKTDELIVRYRSALKEDPANAAIHSNLAQVFEKTGQTDEALKHYSEAVRLNPADPFALHFRSHLKAERGDFVQAMQDAEAAIRLNPDFALAYNNRGYIHLREGRAKEAGADFQTALKFKKDLAEPHYYLGLIALQDGKADSAATHWATALKLSPDWDELLNNYAWLLSTHPKLALRNGAEAVRLAEKASSLAKIPNPSLLATLAAAYAEAGRFDDAIKTSEQAIRLAKEAQDSALVLKLEQRLKLYAARQPYRDS